MNNQLVNSVLLVNTNFDWRTHKIQLTYAIPALSIQGELTMTNDEYMKLFSEGGFVSLDEYIVDHITDYLKELKSTTNTNITNTNMTSGSQSISFNR